MQPPQLSSSVSGPSQLFLSRRPAIVGPSPGFIVLPILCQSGLTANLNVRPCSTTAILFRTPRFNRGRPRPDLAPFRPRISPFPPFKRQGGCAKSLSETGLRFRARTCIQRSEPYERAWDGRGLILVFCVTSKCGYQRSWYTGSSHIPTLH